MAKIIIKNLYGRTILTQDKKATLLRLMHQAGIDWMHSCGGKGKCTTCAAYIVTGNENISQLTAPETEFRQQGRLPENFRLACQLHVYGDVVLKVPEVNQLPHINYGVNNN